jgi:hypothetical protein
MELASLAQDLTVHVVTETLPPKPASGISVQLFPQPAMSGKRKVISQRSDAVGTVVFRDIDLTKIAWSVSIYNLTTQAVGLDVILCRSENAAAQGLEYFHGPMITYLPAEITVRIRRRGFPEMLQYLFAGP